MSENTATFVENNQDIPHATPQMAKLIVEMGEMLLKNDARNLRLMRRKIRYRLFRIRDAVRSGIEPKAEHDSGLKAWIELQFGAGMSWFKTGKNDMGTMVTNGGFSFEWDISAEEPLKVIVPMEWDGGFDQELKANSGIKVCSPPAFTNQG